MKQLIESTQKLINTLERMANNGQSPILVRQEAAKELREQKQYLQQLFITYREQKASGTLDDNGSFIFPRATQEQLEEFSPLVEEGD